MVCTAPCAGHAEQMSLSLELAVDAMTVLGASQDLVNSMQVAKAVTAGVALRHTCLVSVPSGCGRWAHLRCKHG
jgi:hypothetical protein